QRAFWPTVTYHLRPVKLRASETDYISARRDSIQSVIAFTVRANLNVGSSRRCRLIFITGDKRQQYGLVGKRVTACVRDLTPNLCALPRAEININDIFSGPDFNRSASLEITCLCRDVVVRTDTHEVRTGNNAAKSVKSGFIRDNI